MSKPQKMTRRTALTLGVTAVAGGTVGSVFPPVIGEASDCETPVQTEGPFFPKHEQADKDLDLTVIQGRSTQALGAVVYVSGQVLGDDFKPVPGALVDVWQANKHGRYHHEDDPNTEPVDENFQGWGQIRTDENGRYSIKTIIPGAYPVDEEWWRPPHVHFKVAKRGYHELVTQMYFDGDALNDKDSILLEIPEEQRDRVIISFVEGTSGDDLGSKRGEFNLVIRRARKS